MTVPTSTQRGATTAMTPTSRQVPNRDGRSNIAGAGRDGADSAGILAMAYHVSKAKFAALVEQALAELPEQFADFLEEVPVEIRDRPTRKQLKDAGLGKDELLLGLYHGVPRPDRSVEHSGRMPDVIYIFQEDIELVSETEADLVGQVRVTVLHEIGHHFGLSEEDLDELGYG
jgi:predicted Zn-dependent protease with MMP-like domain